MLLGLIKDANESPTPTLQTLDHGEVRLVYICTEASRPDLSGFFPLCDSV